MDSERDRAARARLRSRRLARHGIDLDGRAESTPDPFEAPFETIPHPSSRTTAAGDDTVGGADVELNQDTTLQMIEGFEADMSRIIGDLRQEFTGQFRQQQGQISALHQQQRDQSEQLRSCHARLQDQRSAQVNLTNELVAVKARLAQLERRAAVLAIAGGRRAGADSQRATPSPPPVKSGARLSSATDASPAGRELAGDSSETSPVPTQRFSSGPPRPFTVSYPVLPRSPSHRRRFTLAHIPLPGQRRDEGPAQPPQSWAEPLLSARYVQADDVQSSDGQHRRPELEGQAKDATDRRALVEEEQGRQGEETERRAEAAEGFERRGGLPEGVISGGGSFNGGQRAAGLEGADAQTTLQVGEEDAGGKQSKDVGGSNPRDGSIDELPDGGSAVGPRPADIASGIEAEDVVQGGEIEGVAATPALPQGVRDQTDDEQIARVLDEFTL